MDNLTHSLTGWVLGQTGLKTKSRKGLAALILGANMPDIDVFLRWVPWPSLAMHRGFTHGIGGVVLMPPILAGLLWLLDRWHVHRGKPFKSGLSMRFGWLIALAYLGTLTHPLLDLQTTYAVQLLAPFDTRWFHTETLFIIDVWIWCGLGYAIWLSRRREKLGGNWRKPAIAGLIGVCAYIGLNGVISLMGREALLASLEGPKPDLIIAGEEPILFWKRDMLWQRGEQIGAVEYNPLISLVRVSRAEIRIPNRMNDPLVKKAIRSSQGIQGFLRWSFMPFAMVQKEDCDILVSLGDARFGLTPGRIGMTRFTRLPLQEQGCPVSARQQCRPIVLGPLSAQYGVMNVHSSGSGLRRATARRALRRYGGLFWSRLPAKLFEPILGRIDRGLMSGSLELHLPDESIRMLGGRTNGFTAIVHLDNWRAIMRLATGGSVGWYRAWEEEEWSSPDPVALFALFMANARSLGTAARSRGLTRLLDVLRHARRDNSRRGARRNIADHYDLGNDFYGLWLDETLTYSCARPAFAAEPLETAQRRKIDELLDRIDLKDGDQLLEIGCGWGGLAERALSRARIEYTGLTLSTEQRAEVMALPGVAEASDRAKILLQDYRDTSNIFDAIVSVEMVEAVGQNYWPDYLDTISRVLRPGGRAAIQFISIDDAIFPAYARRADFIQRYIFPGGCLISERRFRKIAEEKGLIWTDQSRFGLDYAWTLRQWRERFDAVVDAGLLPPRFDVHFVDMWRYYLMYCEGGFAGRGIDVAQVTLIKPV